MTTYRLGDCLPIRIRLNDNIEYDDTLNIAYAYNQNTALTCGHCLPSNTTSGHIICSSGFDTPIESAEIGLYELKGINMVNETSDEFHHQVNLLNQTKIEVPMNVNIYYQSCVNSGILLTIIDNPLSSGWFQIQYGDSTIYFNHTVTKLNPPFGFIYPLKHEHEDIDHESLQNAFSNFEWKPKLPLYRSTSGGFSGCPWIGVINNQHYLIGTHIGSCTGFEVVDNQVTKILSLPYVKIITSLPDTCPA